jgi:hypothetical protein
MGKIEQWSGQFTRSGLPVVSFDPTVLGSAVVGWYKSDAGVTTSSGLITRIADQSASAVAFTGASGSEMTLTANAKNGLPRIDNTQASGGAQQYTYAQGTMVTTVDFNYNQPFSVVLAFRQNASLYPTGTNAMFGRQTANAANPANRGWAIQNPQNTNYLNPGLALTPNATSGIMTQLPTPLVVGSDYILQATYNGGGVAAGVTLRINGVAVTPTISLDTLASQQTSSGPSYGVEYGFNFQGSFQNYNSSQNSFYEAVVVNRVLTTQEQANLDAYLNHRFAIFT